jgi:hypothetical protein
MEVDQVEEYLREVFGGLESEPTPEDAQPYRSAVTIMRGEMEVKIRMAVRELEEVGFGHNEAVERTVVRLSTPLTARRQVAREAARHVRTIRSYGVIDNRPWWHRNILAQPHLIIALTYLNLASLVSHAWFSQLIIANALGAVPFLLGVGSSLLDAPQRPPRKPTRFTLLWLIGSLLMIGWIWHYPAWSTVRVLCFGVACMAAGFSLGDIIRYHVRRRKSSVMA